MTTIAVAQPVPASLPGLTGLAGVPDRAVNDGTAEASERAKVKHAKAIKPQKHVKAEKPEKHDKHAKADKAGSVNDDAHLAAVVMPGTPNPPAVISPSELPPSIAFTGVQTTTFAPKHTEASLEHSIKPAKSADKSVQPVGPVEPEAAKSIAKPIKDPQKDPQKDAREAKLAKEALKESLAEGLLAPDVVVRGYRIVRVMRAGQSNNVYVGISPTGQEVAIKEYFPRKLGKRLPSGRIGVSTQRMQDQFESGVKIFVNEAIALAEIRSPLLARVVAAFRENGTAYLVTVMEPGETLEAYARRILKAKIPGQEFPHETDLRLIFWSLLHAVQVMHDAGYLHLDIKPSNVVMRDEFTPVLIDLGGARRFPFDPKKHKVTPGNFTLGFAAPEQHQERTAELCEATDIYGIGASILYCMTGKIPQVASERLVEDKMEDLLKLCKGRYSSQMIDIVRRCMCIRIQDRFEGVKEAQHLIASQ